MNRFVVFTLVLVLALSVPASSLLAGDQTQDRTQTRECVCDGPNCDGDCPQYKYQKESSYSYKGESEGFFQWMWKFLFGVDD